jgi:type I restriction enzyme S subunit
MNVAAHPRYDGYRNDVAPWLGNVPEEWRFEKGKWHLAHRKQLNSGGKIDNVLSLTLRGVVNNDPENPEGLVPKDYGTYQIFDAEDLVFKLIDLENVRTSRVGLVHEKGIMSSAYIRIVIPPAWNARFLYYFYYHLYEAEVFNKIGSGVRSTLGQSDLLELPIPIIERTTQDKIVRMLDEKCAMVDEAVRIKQEQITLLRERRQILIQEAVTRGLNPDAPMKDSGIDWIGQIPAHWEVKRLKHVADIRYGLGQPPKEALGGLPLLRATNVERGRINEKNLIRVDQQAVPKGRNAFLKTGEIIVVRSGAYTGDSAIISQEYDGAVAGYDMVVSPNSIEPEYLGFSLLCPFVLHEQIFLLRMRAAQPHLNREELGETLVLLPPTDEQIAISRSAHNIASKIDHAISIKEDQIATLKEYKTSLINAAVTGKIKVT